MTDDDFREMRDGWGEREWARRFPGAADPTLRHPTQPPECIRTGAHDWFDPADGALRAATRAAGFVEGWGTPGPVHCAQCGVIR